MCYLRITQWKDKYLYNIPINITSLDCSYNELIELFNDSNVPELDYINCSHNKISHIIYLPDTIEHLDCSYNKITRLVLPENIENLNCSHNEITQLDDVIIQCQLNKDIPNNIDTISLESFHNLCILNCDNNHLSYLPKLPPNLRKLSCANNYLNHLPTLHEGLQELNCAYNQIICIENMPQTLEYIYCHHNGIDVILTWSKQLKYIDCSYNKLEKINVLDLKQLRILYCHYNELEEIPMHSNYLEELDISYNKYIMCIPKNLSKNIYHLCITGTSITKIEYIKNKNISIAYNHHVKYIDNLLITWLDEHRICITWPMYFILKKYQRNIKLKYQRKLNAIRLIQKNCYNWIWKPTCKDGTIGIRLRLDLDYIHTLFT